MPGNLIYYALVLIVIALVAALWGSAAWPAPPWAGLISSFGWRSSSSLWGWCSPSSDELKLGDARSPLTAARATGGQRRS